MSDRNLGRGQVNCDSVDAPSLANAWGIWRTRWHTGRIAPSERSLIRVYERLLREEGEVDGPVLEELGWPAAFPLPSSDARAWQGVSERDRVAFRCLMSLVAAHDFDAICAAQTKCLVDRYGKPVGVIEQIRTRVKATAHHPAYVWGLVTQGFEDGNLLSAGRIDIETDPADALVMRRDWRTVQRPLEGFDALGVQ